MKTLYDFPYFLMHIRPFDIISNYNKTNLIWHLHVDNENTTTNEIWKMSEVET